MEDWRDSSDADASTWADAALEPSAARLTPMMFEDTSRVRSDAWPTFWAISRVA
jgi:hypothetical protein